MSPEEMACWSLVQEVDRITAEECLKEYAKQTGDVEGVYVMRHSNKIAGAIVISMYHKGNLYHYQFTPTPQGLLFVSRQYQRRVLGTYSDDKNHDRGILSQVLQHYTVLLRKLLAVKFVLVQERRHGMHTGNMPWTSLDLRIHVN